MSEYVSSNDTIQRINGAELEAGKLYAVLTYRGELASWNWAFFIPNPSLSPIGSSGTLFHIVHDTDTTRGWSFKSEKRDVISWPLAVALVRLADVSFLGEYEELVGADILPGMFKQVATATSDSSRPIEISSRVWFLRAIGVLHDFAVLNCYDVEQLEREIRRCAFAAMDEYLDNKGWTAFRAKRCS
ncbi:hypothetical protein AX17_006001 [Amanita inopinata Kibby_2008]|nr:hypothetical protein AX17_006001 [Amanita inopinata Kibby_2008]